MFILRFVLLAAGLFVLGLGVGYIVTRDRRFLRIGWRTAQVAVVLAVAFGLLYVFERVLLVL